MHAIPVLIIGGGIAGTSLACSLAERQAGNGVSIVDVDFSGKYGSSHLNGGGVRATFAEPLNIQLSLASLKYYRQVAGLVDFRQRGYLWMYDSKLWEQAREFLPRIRSYGLPVDELSPAELKRKYPILGDVSDLGGATLTPQDGRLSPHKLWVHYLNKAQAGGVEILDRLQVVAIEGDRAPFRVTLRRVKPRLTKKVLTDGVAATVTASVTTKAEPGDELTVEAGVLVNAAGPWAPEIARLYGRELPVTALPRQVFLLRHPTVDLEPLPFFIDYPQEIYFRHLERDRKSLTLVSWSDPNEPHRIDFSYHSDAYYREHVEPRLVKRIPAMRDAELAGGWVGHYEMSPDKGAIMGPVPGRVGLFNYNGLSAHGVMQSRGLGDALATFLVNNRWPIGLNLEPLQEGRFEPGNLRSEKMYV